MEEGKKIIDALTDSDLEHAPSSNIVYDHSVDLAAHTKDHFEVLRTGDLYVLPRGHGSANRQLTAGRLYGGLFTVTRKMTFDRIAVQVQTLDAGTHIRLGIYEVGTNLYPGALVLDAGLIDSGGTGVKTITIDQQLTKGIYFTAFLCDGTPHLVCQYPVAAPFGGDSSNWTITQYAGFYVAQAYGALPDPFTAGGTLDSGYSTACKLRPSSMD